MVAVPNRQEPDKWNLHAGQSSQGIPRIIADIQARAVPSHTDKDDNMERDKVGDEDISAPSRNHVSVGQRGQCSPHDRAILDRLNPEVEGKDKEEDCNSFIVVAACDRTGNIARDNSHKSRGEETGRR